MAAHSSVLAVERIPMDRGAWWATVHVVTKSQAQLKHLGTQAHPEDGAGCQCRQPVIARQELSSPPPDFRGGAEV